MNEGTRRIPDDWHDGVIPANVHVSPESILETSYSFHLFRSERDDAIRIGNGSSVYSGTMFDLGPKARLTIGDYVMLNSPRIVCDAEITIGDYTFISWNAVLMDTYRVPLDPAERRAQCTQPKSQSERRHDSALARAVVIERNVWIGFEACVLPGVTIGEGSVIGTRSVVTSNVPAFSLAAGNPARVIRSLRPRTDGG